MSIREQDGERAWDVMSWDVLGGQAAWPMTNVRNLALPQWRRLAEKPENRCLDPADRVLRVDARQARPGRRQAAAERRDVVSGHRPAACSRSRASGSTPRTATGSRW